MSIPAQQNNCAPSQPCCDMASPGCVVQGGVPYQGIPGVPGVAGASGINAYTRLTSGFSAPASGGSVTTGVTNSLWMAPGQVVFVQFAGYYQVTSVPSSISVTLQNLGYASNAVVGTAIPIGALVSPSGPIGPSGATTGVTSVGISVPLPLAVTGTPVTSSGTFTMSFATGQTANQFLATPNGSTGAASMRAIVLGDLPTTVTAQGNTFNGVGKLVQLDGTGALPAVSGAALTSLNASNISTGTLSASALPAAVRLDPVIQAASPLTGTTVTFGTQSTDIDLYLTPAGTLATLTVAFPIDANTFLTQELWILSTQTVTALTVSVAGGTILGTAATTIPAGGVLGYRKISANTWFRIV